MLRPYNVCETCEKLAARRNWSFTAANKNDHASHAGDGKQSIRHRMGEGTISFPEIASERTCGGFLRRACRHAGAEASHGRSTELFSDRECEYLWRISNEPANQRNDPVCAGGDGGFVQLRFE